MHHSVSVIIAFAAVCAIALPASSQPPQLNESAESSGHSHDTVTWDDGATRDFVIHESCNASETIQLRKGLADAVSLANHAKQHILRWGNSSEHYQKYFGAAPSGEAIGYYEKVINGDRGNALFRCDNPDGNCQLPEWGGHWRGENATGETVICPLSYETRRPLEELCAIGYTVAESESNTYFGSDLLHRLYHMPAFGENYVEHFAEDYAGALELAKANATLTTHDSDTLQYFALDVYAYDIVVPGVGCPGTVPEASLSIEIPQTSNMAGTPAVETAGAQSPAAQATTIQTPAAEPPTPASSGTASAAVDVPPTTSDVRTFSAEDFPSSRPYQEGPQGTATSIIALSPGTESPLPTWKTINTLNMAFAPTAVRVAQGLGITTSSFLAGTLYTISTLAVPAILTASSSPSTMLAQWHNLFSKGIKMGPTLALVGAANYLYLAYGAYNSTNERALWKTYLGAAVGTVGIVP
ncbi:MAG: hypothetical protein Q9201_003123 [Fulgogasparrea decipioides]